MMKKRCFSLKLAFILVLLFSNYLFSQQQEEYELPSQPKNVIKMIINLSHGIDGWYDSQTENLIERVKNNPKKYIPYVNSNVEEIISNIKQEYTNINKQKNILRLSNCIALYSSFGPKHSKKRIRSLYDKTNLIIKNLQNEIDKTKKKNKRLKELNSALYNVKYVRRQSMFAMANLNDTYLLSEVSKLNEKKEISDRFRQDLLFSYLLKLAKKNEKAKRLVKKMYNDKSSPLYKNKTAQNVIDESDKK